MHNIFCAAHIHNKHPFCTELSPAKILAHGITEKHPLHCSVRLLQDAACTNRIQDIKHELLDLCQETLIGLPNGASPVKLGTITSFYF